MSYRVVVRGFRRAGNQRAIIFQDKVELATPDEIETVMERLCEEHAAIIGNEPHMIEFEFPDEPEAERYFRFGTDPSLMTLPLEIGI